LVVELVFDDVEMRGEDVKPLVELPLLGGHFLNGHSKREALAIPCVSERPIRRGHGDFILNWGGGTFIRTNPQDLTVVLRGPTAATSRRRDS